MIIWAYHSGPLCMAAVSSAHGFSSPSAVQPLRSVQDTACPLDHWPGFQSISQHSWPTLHSTVDDIASRVTSTPLSKRTRHSERAYSVHITVSALDSNYHLPPAVTVWTSMKDTANSHLNVCIWTILCGAGRWSEAMLVFAEYNTSSRFCIVSFQRSISAQADGRARVCLFTEL